MIRLFVLTGILALAVIVAANTTNAADDKAPDVKAVMKKSFGGKENLKTKIQAAIKEKKWEDAEPLAKEWSECVAGLPKATPKKGEKESWEKLSATFVKNVTTLGEAVKEKDAKKANGAINGIQCKSCHDAHRPKK